MSASTLASAVVRIGIDQSQFRAGLAGVHSQLTGFVGASQLLAGRIAGGLIGGTGQAILAKRAQSMLGPSQANVAREQANVAAARSGLAAARVDLRDAQDRLRSALTATTRAAAQVDVYAARVSVRVAQANVARTTANLGQAQVAATAAGQAFAGTAAGIGMVTTAAAAAVGAIVALAQGLVKVSTAGAVLNAAFHNIDQVFGRWGQVAKDAADKQATAFGRNKAEFLDYATSVGRQLETLGVNEKIAAELATRHAEALSRLAEARRISFGDAAQAAHGTVTDDEIRGYAIREHLINAYGQQLDAASEALLRYQLETQKINEMTDGAVQAGESWNSQLTLLQGTLSNLASTIGTELEPIMVFFLETFHTALKTVIKDVEWLLNKWMDLLVALGGADMRIAVPDPAKDAINERNAASIEQSRKDRLAGAASRAAGGGRGFQGDVAGFSKRLQDAAWNQNTAAMMEKQLRAAETIAGTLGSMLEIMRRSGPRRDPQVANAWSALGGGLASV
jgi:hypothetical protein